MTASKLIEAEDCVILASKCKSYVNTIAQSQSLIPFNKQPITIGKIMFNSNQRFNNRWRFDHKLPDLDRVDRWIVWDLGNGTTT